MELRPLSISASLSLSVSSTALVISSTNKGMPSVRSTISVITSAGRLPGYLSETKREILDSIRDLGRRIDQHS
jgi:hypothetical protein